MCYDRFGYSAHYLTVRGGKYTTACEYTCPVGAIVTDTKSEIMKTARKRLAEARKLYPRASLWGGRGRVIFLLAELPSNHNNIKALDEEECKLGNYGLIPV
jgi:DNA-binding helix-hairpin-helix protein with protein kinase domain